MTIAAPALTASFRPSRITTRSAALILGGAALLARAYVFGDPIVQIDEQFYLLVGGRMLHGALPYVDIFDRKPIGLFLIFSLIRALGGTGVLTGQLLGLASVWATSQILFLMARKVASPAGALAGALLYIVWLDLAGGEATQAPVFYNLPVAAAIAFLFFRRRDAAVRSGDLRQTGIVVMLLFGLAMQIKYTAVFEGLFAGLVLVGSSWKNGRAPAVLALDALIWIACALLPTLAAGIGYALIGHGPQWVYANVMSIALRRTEQISMVALRVRVMVYLLVPLLACVPLRRWTGARPIRMDVREDLRFIDGWAATALLGVILFGTWFNHYALPLFAPFAVMAAPLWTAHRGRQWLIGLLVVGAIKGQYLLYRHGITRGDREVLAAAAAATEGSHGCVFVYDGLPALYDVTGSCLPTTRNFPAHLQSRNEIGATGIDQAQEVGRVMRTRPQRVMTMEPFYEGENMAPRIVLYRALTSDYQEVFRYTGSQHQLVVYGLKGTTRRPAVTMEADRRWPW